VSGTTPSGTIASPGSGEPRDDSAAAASPRFAGAGTPVTVVIVAATVLALGLRLYWLSRPGFLLSVDEYDDGNYFGSAVRLVYGALPYRDFLIVQPPGITLLMIPAALLSKVTGTAWGMAAGRLLTAGAGAAAVALAGLLVRHRGLLATVITCGIMAVYPDSIQATKTVLVEPWLVLFCLLGALALFDGDHLTARTRRLVWGGVALGFGGAVEPWAIFPVLVLAVLALRWPRRLAAYAGGVAAGFLVPVIPFAALAPHSFYEATIVAQIGNRPGAVRYPLWLRLQDMTGLADVSRPTHLVDLAAAFLIVAVIFGSLGLAFLLTWRLPPALDLFAVGTMVLVVAAFLWSSQFHYHFAAFLAPFLAMAIALPVSALARDLRLLSGLLADEVSFAVMTNRLVSDVPGCSLLLDGTGTNFALSHGRDPETGAALSPRVDAVWTYAFEHAQYVWLSRLNNHRVAWTSQLRSYFQAHFTRILSAGAAGSLYRRTDLKPAS